MSTQRSYLEAPKLEGQFDLTFKVEPEFTMFDNEAWSKPLVRFDVSTLCRRCKGIRGIDQWWAKALRVHLQQYLEVEIAEEKILPCTCEDSFTTYREV